MVNYSMEGRTYRYFKGPGIPLYPFGYGLSYSNFLYSGLMLSPSTVTTGVNITLEVMVTNVGPYDSDEVSFVLFEIGAQQLTSFILTIIRELICILFYA